LDENEVCLCKRLLRAEAARLRLINAKKPDCVSFGDEPSDDVLKKRRKLVIGGGDQFEHELCAFFNEDSDVANPFIWWKNNGARYPTLHRIASRLLIVPASSASIERTFSVAKLLTDGLRNRTGARLLNDKLTVCMNRNAK